MQLELEADAATGALGECLAGDVRAGRLHGIGAQQRVVGRTLDG